MQPLIHTLFIAKFSNFGPQCTRLVSKSKCVSGILTMYKFHNMYLQNSTLVIMKWVDTRPELFLKIVSNYIDILFLYTI